MDQLTILRQKVNRPFVITSGYRDPSHPMKQKKILDNTLKVMLLIYYAMVLRLRNYKRSVAMGVFKGIGFQQKGNHSSRFIHLDTR